MERMTKKEQLAGRTVNYIGEDDCFDVWSVPKKFMGNAVDRLAAIEDILGDEYDLDRLGQFAEAVKEGQCGIPPVKLHKKIFRVFNGEIYEEIICDAIWRPLMPRPRWKVFVMGGGLGYYWDDVFGKTVFLTREEAEAALRREQDGE